MIEWMDPLLRQDVVGWRTALLSIVLAFTLAQVIAGLYIWTFRGLSYSRNFVQGVAMAAIVTAMLMLAIGNSIAAGIGIAGGLSIIRFRTTMRDPRDMVFVFAGLAVGIACGLQAYAPAIIGTAIFAVATVFLHWSAFGARKQFDGLLRFFAPKSADAEEQVAQALRQNCRHFVLVTLREAGQGDFVEHAYQVSFPDPEGRNKLVSALQGVTGIRDVTLLLQEPTFEL